MSGATSSFERFQIEDRSPAEVGTVDWLKIQAMSHELMSAKFGVSRALSANEIYEYLQMGDPEAFIADRVDPQRRVERGDYYPDQTLSNPRVITAREDDGAKIKGYMYVVDNVSGTPREQAIKQRAPWWLPKVGSAVYLKLEEVVVDLYSGNQGVAKAMGRQALTHARNEHQRVATYVRPMDGFSTAIARKVGFEDDPVGNRIPHNKANPEEEHPLDVVRMTAAVGKLRQRLR